MKGVSKKESYSRLVAKYNDLTKEMKHLEEQGNFILSKLQVMIDETKIKAAKNKILKG